MMLAVAAAAGSWRASSATTGVLLANSVDGVWFGAEIADTTRRLADDAIENDRPLRRPLAGLLLRLPVQLLANGTPHGGRVGAVRAVMAATSAMWAVGMFVLIRAIGCRRLDATLFAGLALTSAASMFWLSVPDPAGVSSLGLIAIGIVAAWSFRRAPSEWLTTVGAALAVGAEAVHGAVALVAAVRLHPWRRALQVVVNAVCIVLVVGGVQRAVFPSPGLLLLHPSDRPAVRLPEPLTPLTAMAHSVVVSRVSPSVDATRLTLQQLLPTPGMIGAVALLSWLAILALVLLSPLPPPQSAFRRLALSVLGVLYVQHLLFGTEAFTDALSLTPWLVAVASLGTLTRWATMARCLAGAGMIAGATANLTELARSLELARR